AERAGAKWEQKGGCEGVAPHTSLPLAFGLFEAFVDFCPVDDVPPGGEVVGAAVVVLQVVGVLPDVVAEDGIEALRQRGILVGGGHDFELAVGEYEPAPAG